MGIQYFDGNWHTYIRYEVSTLSQDRVANTTTARVSLYIGNDPGGYEIQFDPTYGAYMGVQLAGQNKYLKIEHLFIKGSERSLGSVDFTQDSLVVGLYKWHQLWWMVFGLNRYELHTTIRQNPKNVEGRIRIWNERARTRAHSHARQKGRIIHASSLV